VGPVLSGQLSPARKLLPVDAPRDVWLAARRRLICSSDIASLFGTGWAAAYTVWADKTGRDPGSPTTRVQARGIDLEAAVIAHWIKHHAPVNTGLRVWRAGLMQSRRYRRAGATVDRLSVCVDGKCIVEAKTQANIIEWGTDYEPEVPVGYQFQGQWQLFVTGRDHVHFIVMGPRFVPFDRVMFRDEELIERMACGAARFWGRYVIPDVAPPAVAKDADTLKRMWPEPSKGKEHVLDGPGSDLMHVILREGAAVSEHAKLRDNAVAELQAQVGEATEITWPDGSLAATWRAGKTIDGANADWRRANPDAVDQYGKPVTSIEIDVRKMIADNGGRLPDGLRYRRSFLVKDVAD
jgi:putative phage-type endonuclease